MVSSQDRKPSANSVNPGQRFSRHQPCPVCGGYSGAERGQNKRCYGFLSSDGEWAHCTREEYAGQLPMEEMANTYAHRLTGDCRCGQHHDLRPPNSRLSNATGSSIAATYHYQDEEGRLLFQVVRTVSKRFFQRHPDGNGGWHLGLGGDPRKCSCQRVKLVLYRLPQLLAADADLPVFIVEGEKDADRMATLGLLATCNPMGAGKWRKEYSEYLHGRRVIIIPDNDPEGQRHSATIARSLYE